ncbi:hypothetical protein GCM10027589_30270 [Actinocorallia lasiicapitis]
MKVCVIGAGISGLGAAWALSRHPDAYQVDVLEKRTRLGGNACTVDMPGADGPVPIDISVTACIPSLYHNYLALISTCSAPAR